MFDNLPLLAWIAAVFLLAGGVKGLIGLGLPTISLGLLALSLDLTAAMALLLVPSFVTNIWQAFIGGHFQALLRRLWPFLLCASAAIWLGSAALSSVDTRLLSGLLGLLVIAYALLGLLHPALHLPPRAERYAGPLVGLVNGVLTGLTGSFVVPGVLYLQALGLKRDELVQAMGLLFMASTLALAASLNGRGLLPGELLGVSAAAVLPAMLGMTVGRHLRHRLSEAGFKRVFYGALLLLGLYIAARSFL